MNETSETQRVVPSYREVVDLWNKQADEYNQWDELGEDEKIEWAVRVAGGTSYSEVRDFDWRALGEFRGETACVEAARHLNVKPEKYRCVNTGRAGG